ncbi:MAG: PspC domain-containing protein [Spirochaetales bacterium]|nr:PspC domain-containing protein [Spirochaetales bacterium]
MAYCERTARLYRSRRAMIFGVCQGIADWRGINVGYVRLALIVLTVFTGFFPFGLLYLLAAFFLPLEPAFNKRENRSWYRSGVRRGFDDLRQEFDDLSARFNRMDGRSYSRERDWDDRFKDNRA